MRTRAAAGPRVARRVATDPGVPVGALAVLGGVFALAGPATMTPTLVWAVIGGLAGYSLSGSV